MFVLSVKSEKLKIVLCIIVAVAIGLLIAHISSKDSSVAKMNGIVLRAGNAEERVAFLSQFGWEVPDDPIEVAEVMIPSEFDDTYTKYNEIQIEQGFNLEKYKGVRVKRWTYEIQNYPGYAKDSGCIRANLLVCEDKVIGGDICSVELDGFMHGFENPLDISKGSTSAKGNDEKSASQQTKDSTKSGTTKKVS